MGDGYSLAWRILDAQHWGVPQRRRRIFLVADFAGGCAGTVLFECESVFWDSSPGIEAQEGTSKRAEGGASGGHRTTCLNPWDAYTQRLFSVNGAFHSLCANTGGGMKRDGVVYAIQENVVDRPDGARCNGCGWSADGMFTLNTIDRPAVAFMEEQGAQARGIAVAEARGPTLRASVSGDNRAPCVVYPDIIRTLTAEGADSSPCVDRGQNVVALDCRNLIENCEISGTLQAKTNGGYSLNYINPVIYDCRGNGDGQTTPTITGDHENRITDYSSVLCMAHGQQHAEIYADKSPNLTCKHEQPIVFTQNQRGEVRDLHDMSGALAANPGAKQQTYICDHGRSIAATKYFAQNQAGEVRISDVAGALNTNQNATGRNAPNVVCMAEQPCRYIVRRLTPLECCRLQGFPDGWCDGLASESPSEEEIGRWLRIFAEWDAVQGKPRRRTRRQIEKWLKQPNTDAAEYKAYGNSVAVPCVFFVLAGIVWAMEQEEGCP